MQGKVQTLRIEPSRANTTGRSGPLWRSLRSSIGAVLACTAMLATAAAATAAPVEIYAAGSLTAAVNDLIRASGQPQNDFAQPVYGPAGLLRERLQKGETADIFASADTQQPARLAAGHPAALVVPFARNRMCVVARTSVGLTAANLLDKLLQPSLRLATSTPVADPGGDYARAVFDRAEALHPGAAAILKAKALHLLGSPNAMVPVAGKSPAASIFLGNKADALLYYCSGSAPLLKDVGDLVSVPLPEALEVHPIYSMAILSEAPQASRFALFMLSQKGQQILERYGFLPLVPSQ